MYKLAILASGNGSNLQAIIDSIKAGQLKAEICYVISDRNAYAIERAVAYGISTFVFDRRKYDVSFELDELFNVDVDLIVFAGFLSILSPKFCKKWYKKIINIHPSLLPKYGGSGMYGIKVHQAVLDNKEKETGATVHYVDESVDGGEVIMQRSILVPDGITAHALQKKVLLEIEHNIIVDAIKEVIKMKITYEIKKQPTWSKKIKKINWKKKG